MGFHQVPLGLPLRVPSTVQDEAHSGPGREDPRIPAPAAKTPVATATAAMPPASQPVLVAVRTDIGGALMVPSRFSQTRTVEPLRVPGSTRAVPVRSLPSFSVQRTCACRSALPAPPRAPSASEASRAVTTCRSADWTCAVRIVDPYTSAPRSARPPAGRTRIRTCRMYASVGWPPWTGAAGVVAGGRTRTANLVHSWSGLQLSLVRSSPRSNGGRAPSQGRKSPGGWPPGPYGFQPTGSVPRLVRICRTTAIGHGA